MRRSRLLPRAVALAALAVAAPWAHADDDDPPAVPEDARLRQGAAALEAGRLDEARGWFMQAFDHAQSPEVVRAAAAFDLCLTYYAMGELGRALNGCFRSFPIFPQRSLELIFRVGRAMQDAGLDTKSVPVPEPHLPWYEATDALPQDDGSGATRARPLRSRAELSASLAPPIPAERLEAFRAPPPPLPYRVPPRPGDYSRGFDVGLQGGVLYFANDADPFVAGLRVTRVRRDYGSDGHSYHFGEYLHGVAQQTGMLAVGAGISAERGFGFELALSLPWGRVLADETTVALDTDWRVSYRAELPFGPSTLLHVRASAGLGVNFLKLGAWAIEGIGACRECEVEDPYPNWPLGHVLLTLELGLGQRSGVPPYDRYEIYSPLGGRR